MYLAPSGPILLECDTRLWIEVFTCKNTDQQNSENNNATDVSVASLVCYVCLMVSCVLHFWGLFGRDLFRWTLRCKNLICTAIRSEMKGRKRLVRLYRYLEHLSNGFSSLWADEIAPKVQCCEACVCLSVAWNKHEIRTMLGDWHWEIKGKKKLCIHI